MTNVTKIIEVINANGRQGPKDLKSREVYNWVKRDLDISYEDYLSVLQANAIPADERMRFRNAYFIVSSSGVYSFFKSSEEELRPYICYIIYKTPYLRSSEIKDRMKEIYPHFTLIDQMLQQKELSVLKDYPMNKVTPVESAGENHSYIAIKRSKSAERVLPFDEVSGDVTAVIKNQKMQQAQQKFYGELLSRANVKVLDASIFPEEKQPEAASSDQTAPAASEDKKD